MSGDWGRIVVVVDRADGHLEEFAVGTAEYIGADGQVADRKVDRREKMMLMNGNADFGSGYNADVVAVVDGDGKLIDAERGS